MQTRRQENKRCLCFVGFWNAFFFFLCSTFYSKKRILFIFFFKLFIFKIPWLPVHHFSRQIKYSACLSSNGPKSIHANLYIFSVSKYIIYTCVYVCVNMHIQEFKQGLLRVSSCYQLSLNSWYYSFQEKLSIFFLIKKNLNNF